MKLFFFNVLLEISGSLILFLVNQHIFFLQLSLAVTTTSPL